MLERPIVGFSDIAAALLTSPRQVLVWATRERDPLRLRSYNDIPRILPSKLQAWKDRHWKKPGLKVIRGWHRIAERVELSRMTAIRMSERPKDPLPVKKPTNGTMVWAYESALDDWREAQELPYGAHRIVRKARRGAEESPAVDDLKRG